MQDKIDQIATDPGIALLALNFTYYYMFEENTDKCNFFLSNLKQFVKKNKQPNKSNLIEVMYKETIRLWKGTVNVELSLKTFLMQYGLLQKYLANNTKLPMDPQMSLVEVEEIDQMSSDLAVDKNDFKFDTNRVITLSHRFPQYIDQISNYYHNCMLRLDKYVFHMISQAWIIEKSTDINTKLLAAATIAQGTQSQMFYMNCIFFGPVLRPAVHVHLNALETYGYEQSIVDMLKLELDALNKMTCVPNYGECEQLIGEINKVMTDILQEEARRDGSLMKEPLYLSSSSGDELLDQFFTEFFA